MSTLEQAMANSIIKELRTKKEVLYAAYGEYMSSEIMRTISGTAEKICLGDIKGMCLNLQYEIPTLYEGDDNDSVPVVVWKLPGNDFANIMIREGYPNIAEFGVMSTKVKVENEERNWECFISIGKEEALKKSGIPMKQEKMDQILSAYNELGLDIFKILESLVGQEG